VLVIAAEKMSAILESAELDPNTAILFGDGAGAALLTAEPPATGGWQILDFALHTDGAFRQDLAFDWCSAMRMNGYSVIMQASRKLPAVIEEVIRKQDLRATDIQAFLVHQANQNLLAKVAKSLKVPEELFFMNIARCGNTSSASMLIAAAEWASLTGAPGHLPGDIAMFAAFGAGYHWGALAAKAL
jgi:3-oxoacyl-[acyl-carrier-protein] synthase-3